MFLPEKTESSRTDLQTTQLWSSQTEIQTQVYYGATVFSWLTSPHSRESLWDSQGHWQTCTTLGEESLWTPTSWDRTEIISIILGAQLPSGELSSAQPEISWEKQGSDQKNAEGVEGEWVLNGKQAKLRKVFRLHFIMKDLGVYSINKYVLSTRHYSRHLSCIGEQTRQRSLPSWSLHSGRRKNKSFKAKEITVVNSVSDMLWALNVCWMNKLEQVDLPTDFQLPLKARGEGIMGFPNAM